MKRYLRNAMLFTMLVMISLAGLAMVSEQLGYVIVSDAQFVNRVLAFDPSTGTVLRTVTQSTSQIPEIVMI